MENENNLLSVTKIAEELSITPAKVRKAIADLNLEPDSVKCNCKYFAPEKLDTIKDHIVK